jgi:hypothetical protein
MSWAVSKNVQIRVRPTYRTTIDFYPPIYYADMYLCLTRVGVCVSRYQTRDMLPSYRVRVTRMYHRHPCVILDTYSMAILVRTEVRRLNFTIIRIPRLLLL